MKVSKEMDLAGLDEALRLMGESLDIQKREELHYLQTRLEEFHVIMQDGLRQCARASLISGMGCLGDYRQLAQAIAFLAADLDAKAKRMRIACAEAAVLKRVNNKRSSEIAGQLAAADKG